MENYSSKWKAYCFFLLVSFAACTERSGSSKGIRVDSSVSKFVNKKESKSKNIKLKTLVTHETYTDSGPGFEHFVLIEGFSDLDLDSSTMAGLVAKYIDTVSFPTNILRFYSSDKSWVLNEESHDKKKINRNCFVAIIFGPRYNSRTYIFYDKAGNIKYKGPNWKKY